MRKVNRALEIFWLVITILTIGLTIYFYATEGVDSSTNWYFLFPCLAAAMYIVRRSLRKRLEKYDQQPPIQHAQPQPKAKNNK
jgi:hypothetical protein